MNYYDAREIKKDGEPSGLWHYTVTNDGYTSPVGYCAQDCPGHPTPKEASEHYRQYLLDTSTCVVTVGDYNPCEVCGALTNKMAGVHGIPTYRLCEEHATRDQIAERYTGPGRIISSF
jgi:hypothetical protein